METFVVNGSKVTLFCEEFEKIMPDFSNYVNLVYTDPPYPKQYLHLFNKLGEMSNLCLKRGGSLLSILPHYAIPQIIQDISKYLKWRWLMCMWQKDGQHSRMAMGIEVLWKPIGWWVKESYPSGRGFVVDGFVNDHPKKKNHEWEQAQTWADYLLKFSKPGDLVLDPMMGAGTTGITCVRNGRDFIGIDNDPVAYEKAKERILNV